MVAQDRPGRERLPVRHLEIGEENAGQRIDNFLIRKLKGVPKSRIYRMVRKGEVRVGGRRIKPDYRLQRGDRIRIPPLEIEERPLEEMVVRLYGKQLERLVLYEDGDLLVLNKPSGIAVHGGSDLAGGVIEGLRQVRPGHALELVHRLDRETSGVLLIAKNRSVLRQLHEQFRNGRVEKRYLALLDGLWKEAERLVDAPLRKFQLRGGERFVVVDPERGKPSRTHFRRLELREGATLVEAILETGRTHQIRVHAASLGHPILGDERYGKEEGNRRFRKLGLRRLFLHASKLAFRHPRTGLRIEIETPLPDELAKVLDRIPRSGSRRRNSSQPGGPPSRRAG